jgi:hypothetical protein
LFEQNGRFARREICSMTAPTDPPPKPIFLRSPPSTALPSLLGTASFELEPPDDMEMLRRFRALAEADYT